MSFQHKRKRQVGDSVFESESNELCDSPTKARRVDPLARTAHQESHGPAKSQNSCFHPVVNNSDDSISAQQMITVVTSTKHVASCPSNKNGPISLIKNHQGCIGTEVSITNILQLSEAVEGGSTSESDQTENDSNLQRSESVCRLAGWQTDSNGSSSQIESMRAKKQHSRSQKHTSVGNTRALLVMAFFLVVFRLFPRKPPVVLDENIDPNSVFVPGGGFSGYWYSIGYLRAFPDLESKSFYCYSSGCLSVVAALSNYSIETNYAIASGAQGRWRNGSIARTDVVTDFVENLVREDTPLFRKPWLLSHINIITAVRDGQVGMKSKVRSPSNSAELKEWLIESAWIPVVLGKRLWHLDSFSHDYHMDGAFSLQDHPICAHTVALPWDWDMQINALNVNLGRSKVEKFWNLGMKHQGV
mmetsp:Transcript_32311/g.45949  ORF Transcript_32311/g.45949 Transcript_32311/m.45949 type:complete len:416 (+) Transcript_32311:121-1368(+)|eukprot:CAMPEP_0202464372 /NCGR_PEP_ID=MMETSP1360-20130828/61765_1 /ASSEMBLY_ACC=CAM_ASM_000848 /TAXON_ID=515479 /ORGANISM="Licmophora paradoxa, Strain CCMP2313" /LENGTH=415 /DNA_ID=CAMNT_0049087657 /DNA_START=78 /DNA_END=1325 /DNA_ORIENTATION=+